MNGAGREGAGGALGALDFFSLHFSLGHSLAGSSLKSIALPEEHKKARTVVTRVTKYKK